MFDENDDVENDFGENYLSEEEDEIADPLNIEEDETQDSGFKILTYKNVIENIQNKPKKTIPYLTKFEKARIVGVRLQQLAYGAKPRVDTTGLHTINQIAEQELIQRKIPFILRRTLPNGMYEDWKMEEFQEV